jgi:hypothetical protein
MFFIGSIILIQKRAAISRIIPMVNNTRVSAPAYIAVRAFLLTMLFKTPVADQVLSFGGIEITEQKKAEEVGVSFHAKRV